MKAVSYLRLGLIFIATTGSLSAGTPPLILYCTGYNDHHGAVAYVVTVDLDKGSVHVHDVEGGEDFDGLDVSVKDNEIKFSHPDSKFIEGGGFFVIDRYSGKFRTSVLHAPNGKQSSLRVFEIQSGTCTSNPEKKF